MKNPNMMAVYLDKFVRFKTYSGNVYTGTLIGLDSIHNSLDIVTEDDGELMTVRRIPMNEIHSLEVDPKPLEEIIYE